MYHQWITACMGCIRESWKRPCSPRQPVTGFAGETESLLQVIVSSQRTVFTFLAWSQTCSRWVSRVWQSCPPCVFVMFMDMHQGEPAVWLSSLVTLRWLLCWLEILSPSVPFIRLFGCLLSLLHLCKSKYRVTVSYKDQLFVHGDFKGHHLVKTKDKWVCHYTITQRLNQYS